MDDVDQVDVEAVHVVMRSAHDCAMEMLQNATYIQGELSNVEMPEDLRAITEEVCMSLIGTKHDIISELAELEDLLGAQAETAVVGSRVNRVVSWMGEDIEKVYELVSALQVASQKDPSYMLAFALIAESGANILNAFSATANAAEKYQVQA
jgi:hypothetical protein